MERRLQCNVIVQSRGTEPSDYTIYNTCGIKTFLLKNLKTIIFAELHDFSTQHEYEVSPKSNTSLITRTVSWLTVGAFIDQISVFWHVSFTD